MVWACGLFYEIAAGRSSEIDGLIYEVVRLGEQYGAETPEYKRIADELKDRGLR